MNEDELRALVREAVARHLRATGTFQPMAPAGSRWRSRSHASHYRYSLPDSGGPCLIEPTVHCNHCGYCQSHGH